MSHGNHRREEGYYCYPDLVDPKVTDVFKHLIKGHFLKSRKGDIQEIKYTLIHRGFYRKSIFAFFNFTNWLQRGVPAIDFKWQH